MGSGVLIPDRRRKYFPRNGGPRPTEAEERAGHEGLAAARAALEAVEPDGPSERTVVVRLTPEQIVRARRGIALARQALEPSGECVESEVVESELGCDQTGEVKSA